MSKGFQIFSNRASFFTFFFSSVLLAACAVPSGESNVAHKEIAAEPVIDRQLDYERIDSTAYFAGNAANDPFFDVYEGFRQRRAADMEDTTRPPPIEPYQTVHINREKPWQTLDAFLKFDWDALRKETGEGVDQLLAASKAKRVFDHPDMKIMELMIGEGGLLPKHAEGSPGVLLVVGGRGLVSVDGLTHSVSPGTRIKLEPYAVRSIEAQKDTLKLLWIRWAPNGDHRYIKAGYYLTGANQHVQPAQATLPSDYEFWGQKNTTETVDEPSARDSYDGTASLAEQQHAAFNRLNGAMEQRELYPSVPVFGHESDKPWLDLESITKSNLMWAKDIMSTGKLLDRWIEVVRMESVFQASHGDGRWDFNISQQAWGSGARYVEHSHSIPEFYYVLSGKAQHWNGATAYDAEPGDVFMTNSYQNHESRVVPGEVWRSYGATWAPNGDRSVFQRPHFLLEPLPLQPATSILGKNARFH